MGTKKGLSRKISMRLLKFTFSTFVEISEVICPLFRFSVFFSFFSFFFVFYTVPRGKRQRTL